MKRILSRWALFVVLLGSLLVSAACGGGKPAGGRISNTGNTGNSPNAPAESQTATPAGQPKSGGTIRIARPADATTLDPRVASDNPSILVLDLLFNPLVRRETNLKIEPELATEWTSSSDAKVWTFKLRNDVTFHDGTKMTASDVVFTFESLLDPNFVSRRRDLFSVVDKVEATDEYTVRFTLKSPYAEFLDNLTVIGIVPKAYVEKVGDEKFAQAPIGTGAFVFKEWVKETRIGMTKNPNYFKKGLPYLDEVIMRPLTEDSVRIAALQAGEIDLFQRNVSPEMIEQLKNDQRFVFLKAPWVYYHFVTLNTKVKPLDNQKVRQAIAYAIDRNTIVNDILKIGTPGTGPISAKSEFYNPDLPYYTYDPKKAKQLLAEAGYPNGFEITVTTFTYPDNKRVGEMVQNYLAEVGIKANLEVLDWGVFFSKAYPPKREYQVANTAIGAVGPDAAMYGMFHSKAGANIADYSNPEVDRLLDAGRQEVDTAKRKQIYDQAVKLVLEDSPIIFVANQEIPAVHASYVKGFELNPELSYRQLERVWLDK